MRVRLIGSVVAVLALSALFAQQLQSVVNLSFRDGYNSYLIVAPALALYLLWVRRRSIFQRVESNYLVGTGLAATGLSGVLLAHRYLAVLNQVDCLSLFAFSFCVFLIAIFVFCYGLKAARAAAFPLGMLFFFTPLPTEVAQFLISGLQAGSATLVYWMFSLLGVPVFRQGLVFTVPGVSIEIARECSGINSSVALVLTSLLAAYETLRLNSSRTILVLVSLPFSIIKNAIRIVVLTLLATHVDPSFLTGRLHHQGGFVFFLLTLTLMFPVWKMLRTREDGSFLTTAKASAAGAGAIPASN